jgi:hypothetical protein
MKPNKRHFFAAALALALISAAADAAYAQSPEYYGDQPGWYGRARAMPYAGDCRYPYPPGYRHDLRNWRTGFTDRDFSCYQLDQD